jgi:glycosyltransferase involved in cell wall biosynthesis
MNIGVFMHNYLPRIGGAQICAHCLADRLVHQGHQVTVYARNSMVEECKQRGWQFSYQLKAIEPPFRVIGYLQPIRLIAAAQTIIRQIKKDKLDVIQLVVAWPWLPIVREIKKRTGIPVVIRCAGDDIQVDSSVGYGIRREVGIEDLLKRGFDAVDKGIAISATVTKEYVQAGVQADKIVEIPPGVDVAAYEACQIDPKEIRKQWQLPTDRKLIISVGRNHPKKGFADLVKALPHLNTKEPRFAVAVVGRETETLIPIAKELGVASDFYAISEVSSKSTQIDTFPSRELIELYKASDYFVQPSYIETYANVALEAMASGIPVVITNAPGCIDTVEDGKDGLFIPPEDPKQIAKKVWQLENDETLKQRLIQAGHQKARSQDWHQISLAYLQVYQSLTTPSP